MDAVLQYYDKNTFHASLTEAYWETIVQAAYDCGFRGGQENIIPWIRTSTKYWATIANQRLGRVDHADVLADTMRCIRGGFAMTVVEENPEFAGTCYDILVRPASTTSYNHDPVVIASIRDIQGTFDVCVMLRRKRHSTTWERFVYVRSFEVEVACCRWFNISLSEEDINRLADLSPKRDDIITECFPWRSVQLLQGLTSIIIGYDVLHIQDVY